MSTASVLPSRAAVTPERGSSPVSNSKRTSTATKKITNKDAQDATRRAYAKNEKVSSDSRRTPAATSTRSQRSEQLNKALKEKDTPPTPGSSPHIPVTRKRAAETIEGTLDEEEESVEDEITTNHARDISGGSRDSANSVCLCQPEPKIKRPRNGTSSHIAHNRHFLCRTMTRQQRNRFFIDQFRPISC